MRGYKIFSGTANPALSKKISHYLSLPLSEATVKRFSDGEISAGKRKFDGAFDLNRRA